MKPLFGIISDFNDGTWAGCEALWLAVAELLQQRGHAVSVCAHPAMIATPRMETLRQGGAVLVPRENKPVSIAERLARRLLPTRLHPQVPDPGIAWLRATRPQFLFYSISTLSTLRYDWLEECQRLRIPYALVLHQASEYDWFHDDGLERKIELLLAARAFYFVSHHNQRVLESKFGVEIPQAEFTANPVKVDYGRMLPYPASVDPLRLACVARLDTAQKGQDVLFEVLAQSKWKSRPLHVSLFGSGTNRHALERQATRLGLTQQVHFAGHTNDLPAVWREHHALVMPSRIEGLPIAMVEAMLCGRTAIATRVGGIPEILENNVTGFLAEAPVLTCLDEALERAWQRRDEWAAMGRLAGERIRQIVPADPAAVLADKLVALL